MKTKQLLVRFITSPVSSGIGLSVINVLNGVFEIAYGDQRTKIDAMLPITLVLFLAGLAQLYFSGQKKRNLMTTALWMAGSVVFYVTFYGSSAWDPFPRLRGMSMNLILLWSAILINYLTRREQKRGERKPEGSSTQ